MDPIPQHDYLSTSADSLTRRGYLRLQLSSRMYAYKSAFEPSQGISSQNSETLCPNIANLGTRACWAEYNTRAKLDTLSHSDSDNIVSHAICPCLCVRVSLFWLSFSPLFRSHGERILSSSVFPYQFL